jgi:hypothetical protein
VEGNSISEVVVDRTYSKAPRLGDKLEELVDFGFEHLAAERGTIAGPCTLL